MQPRSMTEPAPGRRLSLATPRPALDRNTALRTVRRARRHVEDGRFTKQAIEARELRFAYLKRLYD
jgi:hypothetical protein